MMTDRSKERYVVPGLKQGIVILRLFSRTKPSWTAPEIARHLKLPRATIYRLLLTLESLDLLERVGSTGHEFKLGMGVLGLGFEYLSGLEIIDRSRPLLEQLRDETGCAAHLAMPDGGDVVYVARYPGAGVITANIGVGARLPAYALGLGRLFLMDLPPQEVRTLFRGRSFKRFTADTPADVGALLGLLAADRRRGYVISRSLFAPGIVAICAPIRDASGKVIAAISVTTLETMMAAGAPEGATRVAVLRTAARISALMGAATTRVA